MSSFDDKYHVKNNTVIGLYKLQIVAAYEPLFLTTGEGLRPSYVYMPGD